MSALSTAPYDAREVANYLLDYADKRSIRLTQMTLLKLLYFCHGWYLFYKKQPLIKNDFEAWENGPVVRVVRDAFKRHGRQPITSRAQKFDLDQGIMVPVRPWMFVEDGQFIEKIFEAYQGFGPWELRDKTHEPGSPWDKLWNSERPIARFGMRIKNEEILAHFALQGMSKSV
jgi:uncharacterized phage-associated protein